MSHHITVAENSKNLARKYVSEGNFGRAFSHYLVALHLNPDWKEQFSEEFSTVLCKWGTVLDEKKKFNDLFECYEQALEIYPNNVVILNNLGAHLLRCGLLREAAHYFRKCVDVDRYFIRAAHNLESVANAAVERWHFRMLNDEHRNEAFREAIIKKVRQGFDKVLDVGTGTGILSLFCAEAKAKEIYACESSPVFSEVAERVFLSNNASTVHFIPKHSTDLHIPTDIPQRLSLLVTETFDAALLGEHILHTLSHAWQHLLLPPHTSPHPRTALVIPFAASLYATPIQFHPLANDLHLAPTPTSRLLPPHTNLLRTTHTYDTHDLSRTPFRPLAHPQRLFRFDFNDPASIAAALAGLRKDVLFRSTTSGRLDCFAVWFDLHLDEDITLNTGPHSKDNSAWDQAIFPLRRSLLVEDQQDIAVSVAVEDGKLTIDLAENCGPGFELSESVMKMLKNDELGRVLEEMGTRLGVGVGVGDAVSVLDCFPFPVFGLKWLMGRRRESGDKVSCVVECEGDKELLRWIGEQHKVEVEVLVKEGVEFGGCFEGRKFDVIVMDVIESSGEIKDELLVEFEHFKSLLKPQGILLPKEVTVMAQFLHSHWLTTVSKVTDDSVTCGFKIAEFINVYQARHFFDLDLKTTEKTFCTEPFELFNLFDFSESVAERSVSVSSDGPARANALVCWLRIKFTEGCEILTNQGNSYNQSAILFPETEFIGNVNFRLIRSNGLFDIELLKS